MDCVVLRPLLSARHRYQLLTSMHFLMSPRAGHPHQGQPDARAGSDRIFVSHNESLRDLAHDVDSLGPNGLLNQLINNVPEASGAQAVAVWHRHPGR